MEAFAGRAQNGWMCRGCVLSEVAARRLGGGGRGVWKSCFQHFSIETGAEARRTGVHDGGQMMIFNVQSARSSSRSAVFAALATGLILAGCSPYAHRAEVEALSTATQSAGELGDRQRDWEIAQRTRDIDRLLQNAFDYSDMAKRYPPQFALSDGCAVDADADLACTIILSDAAQEAVPAPGSQPAAPAQDGEADDDDNAAAYTQILQNARRQANERIERPVMYSNRTYRAETQSGNRTFRLAPADQFAALKQYAAGLMALTDASDVEALQQAEGDLATSLAGVMQSIGPDGEAQQRSELGTALGSGFGLLQRSYLNRQRLRALRAAVTRSDTSFSAVVRGARLYVDAVRDEQLQVEREALGGAVNETNSQVSAGSLDRAAYMAQYHQLDTKAKAFSDLRSADINAAFTALSEAHTKLAEALRDRSSDWVEVSGFVYEFATAVETLNTALDAFEDGDDEPGNAAQNGVEG